MASLGEQYHLKPSGTLPIQTEIPEGICGKVRQGFPGGKARNCLALRSSPLRISGQLEAASVAATRVPWLCILTASNGAK